MITETSPTYHGSSFSGEVLEINALNGPLQMREASGFALFQECCAVVDGEHALSADPRDPRNNESELQPCKRERESVRCLDDVLVKCRIVRIKMRLASIP